MKRDLEALRSQHFDLLIIGGGITGACIARDAAMRGLKVALIDKRDWSGATSAAPSKLVHGGLRYLRNLELGLVRESLAERRIWQRIAPHQVRPLPFLMPADRKGKLTLDIGLTLYDWLSYDRNRLDDPAARISGHKWLRADAAVAAEPVLGAQDMAGAFRYYDCQMRSPERLGLECVMDAVVHGTVATNYVEARAFRREGNTVTGVEVRDTLSGRDLTIRARMTINAAGPWADRMLELAEDGAPTRKLIRSKGIHLITRAVTTREAITAQIPKEMGGGHIFFLPWRGRTIIGTTDTPFDGNPDDVRVSEQEINEYLVAANRALPGAALTRADVTHAYAGLRPLIDKQTNVEVSSSYNTSRAAEIVDHKTEDGLDGFVSALGGKWTTSRHLAEHLVDLVSKRLRASVAPCTTATTPLPGGHVDRFDDFMAQAGNEELALTYGSALAQVLELADRNPALARPMTDSRGEVAAQVIHAIRNEMAVTLEDVVFRRTGLGTLGHPGAPALVHAASLMARELGWSDAKTQDELQAVQHLFFAEPRYGHGLSA